MQETIDKIRYGRITKIGKYKKGKNKATLRIEEFDSGETVKIAFERNAKMRSVFKDMSSLKMPLVTREKTADQGIEFFGTFPYVVESFTESKDEISVKFVGPSGVDFFVSKSSPHIENIRDKLNKSRANQIDYWVVILDNGKRIEIINILHEPETIKCCRDTPFKSEFDKASRKPIMVKKAQKLFQYFQKLSTNQRKGRLAGIPFLFVSDGCEQRAHEMSRHLLQIGIEPLKVWAFSTSDVICFHSPNHPNGEIKWDFHNAVAVTTKNGLYVIDPSTFDRAVSVRIWYDALRNNGTKLYCTSHHVYLMTNSLCSFQSDPEYKRTEQRLRIYRINLRLLSHRLGPLPFKQCLPT